jgi:hypothetical protein
MQKNLGIVGPGRWSASRAGKLPFGLQSSGPGIRTAGGKTGRDLVPTAEVHLIGSLAGEGSVRKDGVVLIDIEGDQLLQCGEGVKLVQVQPGVLERTPPGFDHGIREGHLDLGKYTAQLTDSEQGVDILVKYVPGPSASSQKLAHLLRKGGQDARSLRSQIDGSVLHRLKLGKRLPSLVTAAKIAWLCGCVLRRAWKWRGESIGG